MLSLSRAHDAFATASGSRPTPSSDITATDHLHVHGWRHDDQGMVELSRSERRDGWPKSWMETLDRDTIVDIEERYGPRQDSWWCSHNRDEAQLVESLRKEPLAVQQRQELDNRKIRQQAQALLDSREAQAALDRVQRVRKDTRTSIPTVANSPDVFQAPHSSREAAVASTSKLPFGTPVVRPTKRFATPTVDPQVAAKRRKKDTASSKKALERQAALDEWKSKYTKAFPQFTFHFEYDAATHSKAKAAKAAIERLGGRIDQFFSKKITHLITLRPANAAKSAPLAPKDVNQDLKSRTIPNSKSRGVKPLPRSPGKNPFIETGASAEVSDLAGKAILMGIKVWPVSKLLEVVNLLCPVEEAAPHRKELSQLLEDERLHGTRERDAHAPRHDYYYFGKGNHYLLIEDALGLHRPVMAKEYERNSKTDAQWPVMYTDFLRVSEAVKAADDGTPPDQQREKAWKMYVTRTGWNGHVAPAPYATDADGNLRRSSSLQSLQRRTSGRFSSNDVLPTPPPYQAASGNSIALTSNINSTCNGRTSLESGLSALVTQNNDKRVMQMSKRVQVLKCNASTRVGMSTSPKLGTANRLEGADDELEVYDRPASPEPVTEVKPDRRFKSQKEVIRLLRLSRQPAPCPQDVTVEERIEEHNRAWNAKDASFLATKSGYCENCRVKFESIEDHRKSRRHMRFAEDPDNWQSLDEVLLRVRRLRKYAQPVEPLSSPDADTKLLEGSRYGIW